MDGQSRFDIGTTAIPLPSPFRPQQWYEYEYQYEQQYRYGYHINMPLDEHHSA